MLIVVALTASTYRVYAEEGVVALSSAPLLTLDNYTYTLAADYNGTLTVQKSNIVLDGAGYALTGFGEGYGIDLTGTRNVTVKNFAIRNFTFGVYSDLLGYSENNTIMNCDVRGNGDGVVLYNAYMYVVTGNNLSDSTFHDGVWLYNCSDTTVVNNSLSGNRRSGICLATATAGTLIAGNNVTRNVYAGVLFDSSGNQIIRNKIADNGVEAFNAWGGNCINTWSGNTWGTYIGVDVTGEGVGSAPFMIDANNRDSKPAVTEANNKAVFYVESNSTVTALAFNSTSGELSFTVSGESGTIGYVKATLSRNLTENAENIKVSLDGKLINREVTEASSMYVVTFNYPHSTHKVEVLVNGEAIPEFTTYILALLAALTVCVAVFARRRK